MVYLARVVHPRMFLMKGQPRQVCTHCDYGERVKDYPIVDC